MINEILENGSEEMKKIARNPQTFDFREEDSDFRTVIPENEEIERVEVDIANKNVRVNYEFQKTEEYYICVKKETENSISVVENYSTHEYQDTKVNSKGHYIVNNDKVYLKTPQGLNESLQTKPIDISNRFEDLYEKAIKQDQQEETRKKKQCLEAVPPPEKPFDVK